MEQKLRRPLAWVLTFVMLFTMLPELPASVHADDLIGTVISGDDVVPDSGTDEIEDSEIIETEESGTLEIEGAEALYGSGPADDPQAEECTCGSDDPDWHAPFCALYTASEHPVCLCAEKCPADTPNEWCEVCWSDAGECGASGEVAYLLNGDQSTITFRQTIGSDDYPNFTGDTVCQADNCNASANTNAPLDHVNNGNDKCSVCGANLCAHSWGEYKEITAPTCTEAGLAKAVCGTCGAEDTMNLAALGHDWSDWYTTVEPECEYVGLEQRDCIVCGAYEENVVSALGHNWVWETLPTDSVTGTRHCTTCGTVENEVIYDISYYWTLTCNNKASEIDEGYSWYDDEFSYEEDGYVSLVDLSLAYGEPCNYNTMLKATSLFKSSLTGFTATVDTLEDNNIGTALEKEYPTTLSFLWTNHRDRYDGKDEYSVYTSSLVSSENGSTSGASRYGHMWNEAADGEYSLNIVLSDSCLSGGTTLYGEPDDGEYDWLCYSVVSDGNVHPLRMLQLDPVISAYEPVTVSISTAYTPETGRQDVFCKINDHVYELTEAVDTQLTGQEYYFSAAAYADGVNEATASFMMTDICGETPDTFAGYEHECSTYREEAPTCGANGRKICAECAAVISTTPATGNHNWKDATCTEPKTCSVCDAAEGEAAGHSFTDFCCTVCGTAEGAAVINGTELYDDLADAFESAVSGDKVVLLADIIGTTTYTVGPQQNIEVDLNGYMLRNTAGDTLVSDGADVLIYGTDGGTIRSDEGIAITVINNGNVTICDAITVQCGTGADDHVFSLDDTSDAAIIALGGRYYKDPASAGVKLGNGLAISGSGTNWTVIKGKDYKITFDPNGGKMPDGVPSEMGINYNENYKEATGYEYPVPVLEGYRFVGWYWEFNNSILSKRDWDNGYYQNQQDMSLTALWQECGHSFTDGMCECGMYGAELMGTTLTLEGNIGLDFYYRINDPTLLEEDTGAVVRFIHGGKTTEIPAAGTDEDTETLPGTTLYRFTCELNAKHMTDEVQVQMFAGETAMSEEAEYSVRENAMELISGEYGDEVKEVAETMLHYGAYAQTYFGYNTEDENMADAGLTGQDLSSVTIPETYTYRTIDLENLCVFKGTTLVLNSETKLKVYLQPVTDVPFETLTFKLGDTELEAEQSGDYYVIAIDNIAAQDLNEEYTITVANDENTGTITVSALAYCRSVLNRTTNTTYTEDLKNLLKSMYLYNQAAEAYFN